MVLNGLRLGSRGGLTGGFGNHISLCSGIRFEFHRGGDGDGLGLHCENVVGKSGNRLGQLGHVGGGAVDILGHHGLRFQNRIHHKLHGLRGKGGLLVRRGKDIAPGVQRLHYIPDEVHELVGLGLAGETADFHSTTESINVSVIQFAVSTRQFDGH